MSQLTMTERLVLLKLMARRRIHNHHIRLETLMRCGFKSHERGEVKKAVKSLVKKDFIRLANGNKKLVSINIDLINEIYTECAKG